MRKHYLLDPDIHFLNHGSFGATPRPVMDTYQQWQLQLERQPVQYLAKDIVGELMKARQALGAYLNVDADDLVYIPNATYAVNIIVRSLKLEPGDEILTTDHEYGACEKVWQFVGQTNGSVIVHQPITLPLASPEDVADQFWQGVTPKTKVVFISHITSPTAVRMPVELICQKAREAGIITVVDGAHAPGQLVLDLAVMDPDFYTGNCHKWLQSPKVAGFLYTRKDMQSQVDPLVVSWGWGEDAQSKSGKRYLDYFEWPGTYDPAAFLAVPAAIQFQQEHDWPTMQQRCHDLLEDTLKRIDALTGLESIYTKQSASFVQLAAVRLPKIRDLDAFKRDLLERYRIEIPCIDWNGQHFIRISVQAYNTQADLDALVDALEALLPEHAE